MIELLAVIAVLGNLAAIAVLSIGGIIEKSRRDVCDANTVEFERQYERNLHLDGIEHSDVVFVQFLMGFGENVCPLDGVIRYVNGEAYCSIHSEIADDEEKEDEEGVPFL
ncbi:MAG: type IV pilin protein [Bacillota bacterium]